jgi:hypothetical protein
MAVQSDSERVVATVSTLVDAERREANAWTGIRANCGKSQSLLFTWLLMAQELANVTAKAEARVVFGRRQLRWWR